MARPLSDEKRSALLTAAMEAVASSGVGASTAAIAKAAGVAEGTLFRYFPTKDDLLNQLYVDLKIDLVAFITTDLPEQSEFKDKFRHLWNRFVDWGSEDADKRKTLRQLEVSNRITAESQARSAAMSHKLQAIVEDGFSTGMLRIQPVMFLWGIIQGIANSVWEATATDPSGADDLKALGWLALWGAVSTANG